MKGTAKNTNLHAWKKSECDIMKPAQSDEDILLSCGSWIISFCPISTETVFRYIFLRPLASNQVPKLWVSSPRWKLSLNSWNATSFFGVTVPRHRAAHSFALRLLSCESVRIHKLCFIWLSCRLVSTEAILLKALNRTIYSRRSRDD